MKTAPVRPQPAFVERGDDFCRNHAVNPDAVPPEIQRPLAGQRIYGTHVGQRIVVRLTHHHRPLRSLRKHPRPFQKRRMAIE